MGKQITVHTRIIELTRIKVIYNEGWGQLNAQPPPEEELTKVVRDIDPTRLINSASGWNDHGFGDYHVSINCYPTLESPWLTFLGQPQLRSSPVRHTFLLTTKNSLRLQANWYCGRVWRPRSQCFH